MTDSATKFHITKKGAVEPCGATVKPCPLGGQHFDTETQAQDFLAFEAEVREAKAEAKRNEPKVDVVQTREGEEVEIKDKWGEKKRIVINREWQVKDSEGNVIGVVEYRMVTRERRSKGNRYVNARWSVPGWKYYNTLIPENRRIVLEATSKKAAVDQIVNYVKEQAKWNAEHPKTGRTLLVRRWGSTTGMTFVLVHGIGVSSRYFRRLIPQFVPHGRVLAVELPGFGGAPKPKQALSIEEDAEMLAALLVQRGEKVILVGHSMGAQVVTEVALRVPE
jgi:hypothetical protein